MQMKPLVRLACLGLLAACARNPRPATPSTAPRVRTDFPRIAVIPAPMRLTEQRGEPFRLNPATSVVADSTNPEMQRALAALTMVMRPSTGFALPVMTANAPAPIVIPPAADSLPHNAIVLRLLTFIAPDPLGSEGYTIRIDRDTVLIQASSGAGLFHGVQTLRQLLPFRIEEQHAAYTRREVVWTLPPMTVEDMPAYPWRGAMLDVARHFLEVGEVKQVIDILALYKLNTLHLHLADDQGWRIEIKSHPELVEKGSVSEVAGGPGGFFTQADYAEIVRYADERYVRIVPEIDMPAHINAALISHPELSCGRRPPAVYTGIEVGFSAICPDSAGTYALLDDVIREIVAMTPSGLFHLGGDEVQALTAAQYASFVERVEAIVRKYGARAVGWEDIGKARLDSTSILQLWQSDSLRAGNDLPNPVLASPGPRMYIDMKYTKDTELGLRWAGFIDVRKAYDWDPRSTLKGFNTSRLIGLEAPLWAETVRNVTAVEYLMMPRLPAIAEVAWSPTSARRWESFRRRVAAHGQRWNLLGINYHRDPGIPW